MGSLAWLRPRPLQAGLQRRAGHHAVVEQGFGLAVLGASGGHGGVGLDTSAPSALQLFQQRGVALPSLSRPTVTGISFFAAQPCRRPCRPQRSHGPPGGGRGERCDHRGGAGQALGLELVAQHGGEGIAQFWSALGGSSSTNSSTRRFWVVMLFFPSVQASLAHGHLLHPLARRHGASAPPRRHGKPRRSRLS